jgi:hypothetical protein
MTDKSQHNGASVGQRIERAFLQLVRAYTYNTPIPRGKYRLYTAALNLCRYQHDSLRGKAKDGRDFWINLSTGMHEKVYFVGEFERTATTVAGKLVRKGDVCIDVGANFGWYTTLFAANAGPGGSRSCVRTCPGYFSRTEAKLRSALASGQRLSEQLRARRHRRQQHTQSF